MGRLSKIARKELMMSASSTSASFYQKTCNCDCHKKKESKTVTKNDVGTQTGMFDFPSFESDETYSKIADERLVNLDHSYFDQELMRPPDASTPDFHSKSKSLRSSEIVETHDTEDLDPLLLLSPTVCDFPSQPRNKEKAIVAIDIESPINVKKRKTGI